MIITFPEPIRDRCDELFALLFKKGIVGMTLHSLEHGWLAINEVFCDMLGYTQEELNGLSFLELTHPDDRASGSEQYHRVLNGEIDSYTQEKRYLRKDGETVHAILHLSCIRDSNGKVEFIITIVQNITRIKTTELALIADEHRYRALFDESPVPLWEEDFSEVINHIKALQAEHMEDLRDYLQQHPEVVAECARKVRILDINKAVLDLHRGATKAEILQGLPAIFTTESLVTFREELIAIAEGRNRLHMDSVVQTLSGDSRHIDLQWQVVPGYEQSLARVFVSTVDITRQKTIEMQLRRAQEIIDASGDLICLIDPDYRFMAANRSFLNALGFREADLIGRTVAEAQGLDFFNGVRDSLDRCLRGESFSAYRYGITPQLARRYLHVAYNPFQPDPGQTCGAVVTLRDITEYKNTEVALSEHQRRLATLLDNLPGLVYRCHNDPDWTMEFMSQNSVQITGWNPDAFTSGRVKYGDLIHPKDRQTVWDEVQGALERRSPYQLEYRIARADGALRWIWEQGCGVYDPDGGLAALEGYITDITTRKTSELAQIYRAHQLAVLGELGRMSLDDGPLDELLQVAANALAEVLEADAAGFFERRPGREAFVLRIGCGWPQGLTGVAALPDTPGALARRVLESGELLLSGDLAREETPAGQEWLVDLGLASAITIMIRDRAGPWGLLGIYSRRAGAFDEGKVSFIRSVANLLGETITRQSIAADLRQNEIKYRSLMEASSDGIVLVDRRGRIDTVNRKVEIMTGYSRPQLVGRPVEVLVPERYTEHKELRENYQTAPGARLMGRGADIFVRRADGSEFPAEITLTPLQIEDGPVVSVTIRDITARKRWERDIRRYRNIVNATDEAIAFLDRDCIFRVVNDAYLRDLDKTRAEVIGRHLAEVRGREYYESTSKQYFERCLCGESIRYQGWFEDAGMPRRFRDVYYNPYLDEGGAIAGVVISVRDLSARKKIEDALQQTTQQLRQAQRIARLGFWEADLITGRITWPDETYAVHGVSRDNFDPSGGLTRDLIHPDDREAFAAALQDAAARGSNMNLIYRITPPDGRIRYLQSRGEAILDERGKPARLFGISMDITRRMLEEQDMQSSRERLRNLLTRMQEVREEERTTIAREIHDELGQTLTAMKIDLSLIVDQIPGPVANVKRQLQGMIRDIDATIVYVRKLSSSLRPPLLDDIGLDAAIEWQLQGFSHRTGCQFSLDASPNEIRLDHDAKTAMFRIFQEALNNIARHANADHIDIALRASDADLVLTVKDNGIGIDDALINSPRSIGLIGMQERAAIHGGAVTIIRGETGGTLVTVRMPLSEGAA